MGIIIGSIAVQELGGQIDTHLFPVELKNDSHKANTVGWFFAMFAITGGWVLPIGLTATIYGFFDKVSKKRAIVIGMILFVAVGIVYIPPMVFYHGG
jgi:hypothetical protein